MTEKSLIVLFICITIFGCVCAASYNMTYYAHPLCSACGKPLEGRR